MASGERSSLHAEETLKVEVAPPLHLGMFTLAGVAVGAAVLFPRGAAVAMLTMGALAVVLAVARRMGNAAWLWIAAIPVMFRSEAWLVPLGVNMNPRISLADMILLTALPFWTVRSRAKGIPQTIFDWGLRALFLAFTLGLVTRAVSVGNLSGYALVTKYLGLVALMGAFYMLVSLIEDEISLRKAIYAWFGAAAAVAAVGFVGFVLYHGFGQRNFLMYSPRIQSLMANPNAFGGYMAITAVFATSLYLSGAGILRKNFFLLLCSLLSLAAILSISRGAILALAVGLAVAAFLHGFRVKRFLPLGVFIAGAIALGTLVLGRGWLNTFVNVALSRFSAQARLDIDRITLDLIREHPFLGMGLGRAMEVIYISDNTGHYQVMPHNTYLWLWVDMGILALVAFLGLLVVLVRNAWVSLRHAEGTLAGSVLRACLASAVAYAVFAVFHESLYQRVFWLLLALAAASVRIADSASRAGEADPGMSVQGQGERV